MRALLLLATGTVAASLGCSDQCFVDGLFCSYNDARYRAIAAGDHHTCGVHLDGVVECWGRNDHGEASPPAGSFAEVVAGDGFSCGRTAVGDVTCWGDPAVVQGALASAYSLAAGRRHVCGVSHTDRLLRCWGDNSFGQLDPPGTLTPSDLGYRELAAGRDFACARPDQTARFQCWGRDDAGQLAIPPSVTLPIAGSDRFGCGGPSLACWGEVPPDAPTGSFTALAGGATHMCGITADGTIRCWGDATGGKGSSPAGEFEAISAGSNHTCALKLDGHVRCWGDDSDGQSSPPNE